MFHLNLYLESSAYHVTAGTERTPREFLSFSGAYDASGDRFESLDGTVLNEISVRIVRAEVSGEPGVIQGLPTDRGEASLLIEMALPPSAFDRISECIARKMPVRASFSDGLFVEESGPVKIKATGRPGVVWDTGRAFRFALCESSIGVRDRPASSEAPAIPQPLPDAIPRQPPVDQFSGIKWRLTLIAGLLAGILFYVAR